jgi:hypothetical protein
MIMHTYRISYRISYRFLSIDFLVQCRGHFALGSWLSEKFDTLLFKIFICKEGFLLQLINYTLERIGEAG